MPRGKFPGTLIAWIAGLLAALPFYQQAWFVGPIAAHYPMLGDVSYFVGFGVAFVVARMFAMNAKLEPAP
jgi:NCS1 family nucleobase:cation symporter-1